MGETMASVRWQRHLSFVADDINNVSFYQGPLEFIEDGHSIFGGLLFANIDFIRHHIPFLQRAQVLAVDGTFEVVPRFPEDIDQLVTIHAVLDNIVRFNKIERSIFLKQFLINCCRLKL